MDGHHKKGLSVLTLFPIEDRYTVYDHCVCGNCFNNSLLPWNENILTASTGLLEKTRLKFSIGYNTISKFNKFVSS